MRLWRDTPLAERGDGAYLTFDSEHAAAMGIRPTWLKSYISAEGRLTQRGEKLLGIQQAFVEVTQKHIDDWHTAKALNKTKETRPAFARRNSLDPDIFGLLVTAEGTATNRWASRIRQQQLPSQRLTRMTPAMLDAVQQWYLRDKTLAVTFAQHAHEHNVLWRSLLNHVTVDGVLTEHGQRWLDPVTGEFTDLAKALPTQRTRAVTVADILAWRKIASGHAPKMTMTQFTNTHQLSRPSLSRMISVAGMLTPLGENRFGKQLNALASEPAAALVRERTPSRSTVSWEVFEEFFEPTSPGSASSMPGHAVLNNLDFAEWSQYVRPDRVLLPEGWAKLAQSLSGQDIDSTSTARVKLEIDNNAFLFSDLDDASKNLLEDHVLDISNSHVTEWGALNHSFKPLPPEDVSSKQGYLEWELGQWLETENSVAVKEKNFDRNIRQLMTQAWAGHTPTVVAAQDLQSFTILGPYRGELLPGDARIADMFRRNPRHHVLSYLFALRSGKPVPEATVRGNLLSLMNTSQLPDTDALPGLNPLSPNNVALVTVDQDVYFYVTTQPINKGEELRVDYAQFAQARRDVDVPSSSRGGMVYGQNDQAQRLEQALANIRTLGEWQRAESDIVPKLAGDFYPQGVVIRYPGEVQVPEERVFRAGLPELAPDVPEPITLELRGVTTAGAHYSATYRRENGDLAVLPTAGGGDCFYRALYATAHRLEDPGRVTMQQIQTLRDRLANLLEANLQDYYNFLNTRN